jgi:hypothetical protein
VTVTRGRVRIRRHEEPMEPPSPGLGRR